MPIVTRVSSGPEELQGAEVSRVHLVTPEMEAGSFWEDLKRVRQARTAWRAALKLGELVAEHPPG